MPLKPPPQPREGLKILEERLEKVLEAIRRDCS